MLRKGRLSNVILSLNWISLTYIKGGQAKLADLQFHIGHLSGTINELASEKRKSVGEIQFENAIYASTYHCQA